MRYVGRHRAARPLLLRRPVAGGVAAAVALVVPVLYVSGNFGPGIIGSTPTNQIAEGKTKGPTPAGAETATGKGGVVIPVDDDPAAKPADPQVPANANPGVIATAIPVGGGVGGTKVPVATKSPRPGVTKSPTVPPTVRPTRTTRPPAPTTTTTTTTKPPVVEPTKPPVVEPTKPPTTEPKPPTSDSPKPTATGTGAGTPE